VTPSVSPSLSHSLFRPRWYLKINDATTTPK